MDIAIDTISKFLTDQLDGTAARMVAAAAKSVLTGSISTEDGKDTRMKVTREGHGDTSRGVTTRDTTTRDSLVREGTMLGATAVSGQQSRLTVNTLAVST